MWGKLIPAIILLIGVFLVGAQIQDFNSKMTKINTTISSM